MLTSSNLPDDVICWESSTVSLINADDNTSMRHIGENCKPVAVATTNTRVVSGRRRIKWRVLCGNNFPEVSLFSRGKRVTSFNPYLLIRDNKILSSPGQQVRHEDNSFTSPHTNWTSQTIQLIPLSNKLTNKFISSFSVVSPSTFVLVISLQIWVLLSQFYGIPHSYQCCNKLVKRYYSLSTNLITLLARAGSQIE